MLPTNRSLQLKKAVYRGIFMPISNEKIGGFKK
jgi:hypothetical protein